MADQYDNYEDDDLFEDERTHRRRGIDLTSTGFRIAATLVIVALVLLLISLVVRPGSDEEVLDPVPTQDNTAQNEQPNELATFTPGPTSTPPPLDEPTPGPTQAAEPGSGSGLTVNGAARVTGTGGAGVNLRSAAGTSAPIVQIVGDDTGMTLLEGPTEADGFTWWRVRLDDGTEGWLVQDFLVP